MAAFYLDNDVSHVLTALLQSAGHHVTTTRDLGQYRAGDDAQLLTAMRNGWVLVTLNRGDFTMLHDAWLTWPAAFGLALPPHEGILMLDHAKPDRQFSALQTLLAATVSGRWTNGLLWWDARAGW